MTVTIYGIKNCDTMRKARNWLDEYGVNYTFHDYKKDGLDGATLDRWMGMAEWEKLLNRAGTTFRKLSDEDKQDITAAKAKALLLAQPSMVKRPVLEREDEILIGFKPEQYEDFFHS